MGRTRRSDAPDTGRRGRRRGLTEPWRPAVRIAAEAVASDIGLDVLEAVASLVDVNRAEPDPFPPVLRRVVEALAAD